MTNKDAELHMWEYWRDDKGYESAAQDYFPKLFSRDPVLQMAMLALESAKQLIDQRMSLLANRGEL